MAKEPMRTGRQGAGMNTTPIMCCLCSGSPINEATLIFFFCTGRGSREELTSAIGICETCIGGRERDARLQIRGWFKTAVYAGFKLAIAKIRKSRR